MGILETRKMGWYRGSFHGPLVQHLRYPNITATASIHCGRMAIDLKPPGVCGLQSVLGTEEKRKNNIMKLDKPIIGYYIYYFH